MFLWPPGLVINPAKFLKSFSFHARGGYSNMIFFAIKLFFPCRQYAVRHFRTLTKFLASHIWSGQSNLFAKPMWSLFQNSPSWSKLLVEYFFAQLLSLFFSICTAVSPGIWGCPVPRCFFFFFRFNLRKLLCSVYGQQVVGNAKECVYFIHMCINIYK